MAYDGRRNIVEISDDEKTVYFETWKPKKISGTKIGGILGYSPFATPFKVACEIAGIYPGDKANKYIDAGNILEPVIRNYIGMSATKMLSGPLNVPEGSRVAIEQPVEGDKCGYDHFHDNKLFGGLVDGYVRIDNERKAILEIKTAHEFDKWKDENGLPTNVPMTYMLQASLYAELSGLDKVVFAVGFLKDPEDYLRPTVWKPSEENTFIVVKDRLDMSGYMAEAEAWYKEFILNGYTPEWTEKDEELLKYLRAKPKDQKNGRR